MRARLALLLLPFSLLGCVTTASPTDPATLSAQTAPAPRIEDHMPGEAGPETLYTVPAAWDSGRPGALVSAQGGVRPVDQKRIKIWGGWGTRYTIGGDALDRGEKGSLRASSYFSSVAGGPLIFLKPTMVLIPYGLYQYGISYHDTLDYGWDISTLAVGARFSPMHSPRGGFYLMADAGSMHWHGFGSQFGASAPNFDGFTWSMGAGVSMGVRPWFGFGFQWAYRDFDGSNHYDAVFSEFTWTFTFKF